MVIVEESLIDTGVAAMLLKTSQANVRQLIRRGHLTKHGTDKRRSLVRYEDVLRLMESRDRRWPKPSSSP